MKKYDYLVIANSIQEPDKFPIKYSKLFIFPKLLVGKLPFLKWLYRAILLRLLVKTGFDNIYFYNKVKSKGAELIHAHFAFNGYKYLPLAKKLNIPIIVSFYGYDYDYLPQHQPKWIAKYKIMFENVSAFICEGNYGKQKLIDKGCQVDKIIVNHLGVSVQTIAFKSREWKKGETLKFCQIASLDEKKGHKYTIKAFAKLLDYYSNAELLLIGNGKEYFKLTQLVKKLGIQKKVCFKKFIPYTELYNELHLHHVFIHPSVTASDGDCEGGAPVILLDAQATGMPILSTFHCDIPEEVVDGKSGILVPEKDIESLTHAMQVLIDNPELIKKYGKYGRMHVENNYDMIKCSQKLEEIYTAIL